MMAQCLQQQWRRTTVPQQQQKSAGHMFVVVVAHCWMGSEKMMLLELLRCQAPLHLIHHCRCRHRTMSSSKWMRSRRQGAAKERFLNQIQH
jgi:hypothetical protein